MTSTPEQVIAKIREALEAGPTPGPWEVYAEKVNDKHDALSEASYQIHYTEPFVGKMFMINAGGKCPAMTGCGPTSEVNADWLAAVNPQNIAVLMGEISDLQSVVQCMNEDFAAVKAERDALRKALEGMRPHVDKLARCVLINDEMGRVVIGQTEATTALAEIFARTLLAGDNHE